MYRVAWKKIYIEFCNFDFSILSATPLGKISIRTTTPSLLFSILNFIADTSEHTYNYRFNK